MTARTASTLKARPSSPGDHDLAYRALCLALAGRLDLVDWSAFSPTDWDRLIATARAEGVAPLLYHALEDRRGRVEGGSWKGEKGKKEEGKGKGERGKWKGDSTLHSPSLRPGSGQASILHSPPSIFHPPSSVLHELRAAYYATAAHNLLLYHELTRILQAIDNSQLTIDNSQLKPPVVVLKGAALATTLYPTPALRPLSDIDLLIPRQHLEPAVQAVKSLGYRQPYPEMAPDLNRVIHYHVHLRGGPQQSVAVELHWNLIAGDSDWRTPSLDWFWEQTEEWKMEGGEGKEERGKGKMEGGKGKMEGRFQSPLSTLHSPLSIIQLTPTAHLLYLAAHLMLQHGATQARLLWYYDLHLLATREAGRLDWDELLARAREFRWAAALHAALQGAQERFGTPLPAGFLDALAEVQDRQAVRSVERKAGPVQTRAVRVWDGLEAQGWRGRLRLAWAIACPRPAYMRWRYRPRPAWLWPLWYPYRWFDIVRDGVATVWRIGKERMEGG